MTYIETEESDMFSKTYQTAAIELNKCSDEQLDKISDGTTRADAACAIADIMLGGDESEALNILCRLYRRLRLTEYVRIIIT